jgi:hypothetical protein
VGITSPLGVVAGAAAAAAPGAVLDVRHVMRQRKTRGWVSVHQRIDRMRLSGYSPNDTGRSSMAGSSAVTAATTPRPGCSCCPSAAGSVRWSPAWGVVVDRHR